MEKSISIKFENALSQIQEEMLIQQFQVIIRDSKRKLEKTKGVLSSIYYRKLTGEISDAMANQIYYMLENWEEIFRLEKPSPNEYAFIVSNEFFRIFEFNVNLPANVKIETGFWSGLKRELPKHLEHDTFKKMALGENHYLITFKEE